MTLAHDALSDLEALAYEAALEPSLWPQVAADASRAFEATYMMLRVADRRGKNVMHAAPPGFGELAEVIMARYSTVETNASFAFAALTPPAAVGLRDRIVSDSDLERREFYQEIFRPLRSMARRDHERASRRRGARANVFHAHPQGRPVRRRRTRRLGGARAAFQPGAAGDVAPQGIGGASLGAGRNDRSRARRARSDGRLRTDRRGERRRARHSRGERRAHSARRGLARGARARIASGSRGSSRRRRDRASCR